MTRPNEFSSVKEIKAYLVEQGVEFRKSAKKPELVRLLNSIEVREEQRNEESAVELMSPQDLQRAKYIENLLQSNDSLSKRVEEYIFLSQSAANIESAALNVVDATGQPFIKDEPMPEIVKGSADQPLAEDDHCAVLGADEVDTKTAQIEVDSEITLEDEESQDALGVEHETDTPSDEHEVTAAIVEDEIPVEEDNLELEESTQVPFYQHIGFIVGNIALAVFLIVYFVLRYLM